MLNPIRIRTITAFIDMASLDDAAALERALSWLPRLRRRMQEAGFEVQTVRVATHPLLGRADASQRQRALPALEKLDAIALAHDAVLSIGSVLTTERQEPGLADWAVELVRRTQTISFSVSVSSERGVHRSAVNSAAQIVSALSHVDSSGFANFRFAAAAGIPPGTPFFPVAYHQGPESFAFGLESAGLVHSLFSSGVGLEQAEERLREALNEQLGAVEKLGQELAAAEKIQYLGIDPSPAPGVDHSIGAAIEALTGAPFGHPSTLQACAAITAALKTLEVRSCGYAGLMLPVAEDPVLARRANERRYGLQEVLLYSTVCGTGLDVVPIPGDTPVEVLAQIIGDVAALASRLRKPLSARLFPVPGRKTGEMVGFDDPRLVECRVFEAVAGKGA